MKIRKIVISGVSLVAALTFSTGVFAASEDSHKMDSHMNSMNHDKSGDMKMSSDMKMPTNLEKAKNPKFKAGQKITVLATHMDNMKNAKGKVVAAYNTKLYEVNYQPTNGGEMVKNHKWITANEFKDMKKNHKKGDKVVLTSDHMEGMKGAKATITNVKNGPAYVIDYQPTNGGEMVKNHMFIAQNELKAR